MSKSQSSGGGGSYFTIFGRKITLTKQRHPTEPVRVGKIRRVTGGPDDRSYNLNTNRRRKGK